jgi:hypothetical protein
MYMIETIKKTSSWSLNLFMSVHEIYIFINGIVFILSEFVTSLKKYEFLNKELEIVMF